jgi:hypothetical protein
MLLSSLLGLLISQLPETGLSKQSRGFFEKLIDLKLEGGAIAVKLAGGPMDVSSLRTLAFSAFPGVARVSVRSQNGSTSSSRGGAGGEVSISLGQDGGPESMSFRIAAPSGDETLTLTQSAPGQMTFEVTSGKYTVRYEQEKGKHRLRVRAGAESFNITRASLAALLQAEPLGVKKYLFGALDVYLDKPPFVPFAAAPPGKTVVRLRDGAEVFGELDVAEVVLETAYGSLRIPRGELLHVFLPGADPALGAIPEDEPRGAASDETVVVTKRFSPRGRLDLESFRLRTPYGDLELAAAEILHIAFGPELEPEAGAGAAPAPETK